MSIQPCTSTPVQRGVVLFEPAVFKAAYPEFATITDPVLSANFDLATLVLANSCRGAVQNAAKREQLLNLLVAHITQLRNGINGQPASGVVGQVTGATQGTVSVEAFAIPATLNQAWFSQTAWGLLFWTATASFRTMRYVAPPAVCADNVVYDNFPNGAGGGSCW
jgi:hypothetical protein